MEDRQNKGLNWAKPLRIVAKAAVLFLLLNLLFAWLQPLEPLGRLTLYNWLLPGRERLPYGEIPAAAYNLSLYNLPAMTASHVIGEAKAEDEFRVLILGDSGTWGWFLENEDSLAGNINAQAYRTKDGRRVVAYNLGYPVMSLTKDLMILDALQAAEGDLILWPLTLASFPREKQLFSPVVQNNPGRVRPLIEAYDLNLDPDDDRFVDPDFMGSTLTGRRRDLADLLRLQLYGFSWAATEIDQVIPEEITPRKSDFEEDLSWESYAEPVVLDEEKLAFDVLRAGLQMAADTPMLIINEPMFISSGQNSDLRYNSFYPRWAYDAFRRMMGETAAVEGWSYLDLWDRIAPEHFSDTPVHLTPAGSRQYAELIGAEIIRIANGEQ